MAEGLGALRVGAGAGILAHGTTVATNALLERRGAAVALVTNAGLEDVIEIARQDRPSLYDPWADRPEPLVPRSARFGVAGRLGADGRELAPVDLSALPVGALLAAEPSPAVAVCLLHSDLDATHERAVAAVLRERGLDVTCSHEVSPEFREYERTVTTVVNAYLRPVCRAYLQPARRPLASEVARHDLGRRARRAWRRRPTARPPCCCPGRRPGCGRPRPSPPPTGSPARSASTWAARPPTCA